MAVAGMIVGQHRRWLQGIGSDAVVDQLEPGDLRRAIEGARAGVPVAHLPVQGDVAGRLVPKPRRPGLDRGRGAGDAGQGLIGNLDQLRRVVRRRPAFGHHEGDRLAQISDPVLGEQRLRWRDRSRSALGRRAAGAGQAAQAVGHGVGAGQHGENARGFLRRRGIDSADFGMGVGRAQDLAVGLTR